MPLTSLANLYFPHVSRKAAFRAEEGKKLVVADYGQLELRLLAHITDCKSMIEAFEVRQGITSRGWDR